MNLYHEIKVLSRLLKREFDASEEKSKIESITSSNGSVIGFIALSTTDVYQKDVEAHFSVRRSTASRMLGTLEEKGLIRRESVESDARLKKILLTDEGWELHRYVSGAISRISNDATYGIPKDELESFYGTLEKIKANLITSSQKAR